METDIDAETAPERVDATTPDERKAAALHRLAVRHQELCRVDPAQLTGSEREQWESEVASVALEMKWVRIYGADLKMGQGGDPLWSIWGS